MSILANAQLLTLFYLFRMFSKLSNESNKYSTHFKAQLISTLLGNIWLHEPIGTLLCSKPETYWSVPFLEMQHLSLYNSELSFSCMHVVSLKIHCKLFEGRNKLSYFNTIESIKYPHSARNIILINSFIYSFIQLRFFFAFLHCTGYVLWRKTNMLPVLMSSLDRLKKTWYPVWWELDLELEDFGMNTNLAIF